METYKVLFGLVVEHLFFYDSLCRDIKFIPTENCMNLMKKIGLIMKKGISSIQILYDEDRKDTLLLYADDQIEPLNFSFKAYSQDPYFLNYTDLSILVEDKILSFDIEMVKNNSSTEIVLNEEEFVSEKDFEPIDSNPVKKLLSKSDRLIKPIFIINICAKGISSRFFDEQTNVLPQGYLIKFRSRATYWNYYLLGKMKKENLYIADLSPENKSERPIEFEMQKGHMLPGNKPALVLKSKSTIPILENSYLHFQLRERNSGNDKVLIKRLPVASSNQFHSEVNSNGKKKVEISEIYINY